MVVTELQQFVQNIPSESQATVGYVALVVAGVGVALWAAGSRFGRSMLTLAGVAGGAALGLRIPGWFGIDIRNWATAVGGALVLGLVAYLLHKVIVRFGLGLLLAAWAGVACWMLLGPGKDWKTPELTEKVVHGEPAAIQEYALSLWKSLPTEFQTTGPIAVVISLIAGLVIGAFLIRLAMAMFYSVLGVTVTLLAGLLAMFMLRPQLGESIPSDTKMQLGILLGAAVVGTLIQWLLAPRARKAAPPPPPEPEQPASTPPPVPRGDTK